MNILIWNVLLIISIELSKKCISRSLVVPIVGSSGENVSAIVGMGYYLSLFILSEQVFFLFWCNLALNYAMTSLKYGFLNEKGILLVKQCAYLQFALCAFMISLKCHLPRLNKKIVQFADHTFPVNPLSTRKQHHVLTHCSLPLW